MFVASHPSGRGRPTLALVLRTSRSSDSPRPLARASTPARPAGTFAWTSSIPCRSWLAAPSSPPGAVSSRGRSRRTSRRPPVVPRNALPDSVVSDEGLVRADTVGTLPAIQHSYAGVFDAAGTGALSGVVTDKLAGGWWDGVANAKDERPVLELQAIHDEARKRLTSIVLETFESAFKTYAPAPGDEAEAAQDLLAAVAETSTKEWLLGSRAAAAEATSAADGSAFEEESEDGAVDEIMMRRAGDLAAGLIVVDQVESPGSKSALYVNLLSHMASLSEAAKAPSEDGEMAEAAIELAAAAKQREDEGLNFSMAAVSVTVLEDAALRVSEAVASAYLSRVREGAPRPASESRGRRVSSPTSAPWSPPWRRTRKRRRSSPPRPRPRLCATRCRCSPG